MHLIRTVPLSKKKKIKKIEIRPLYEAGQFFPVRHIFEQKKRSRAGPLLIICFNKITVYRCKLSVHFMFPVLASSTWDFPNSFSEISFFLLTPNAYQ